MRRLTADLTQGSPLKAILRFAIPVCLGLILQQLYSMIDTMLVGRVLGMEALAGVGSTNTLNFTISFFCIGAASGFAIPAAQAFGAKDYDKLRGFVGNSLWLGAISAAATTVLVCALTRSMLLGLGTRPELMEDAYAYCFTMFLGLPFIYLYNYMAGLFRALGDSKTPLMFLAVSSGINIVLDILFMVYCGFGVAGAAWATVISQAIAGVVCVFYAKKKFPVLAMSRDDWKYRSAYIRELAVIGFPMGVQFTITGLGTIVVQMAVNSLGAAAVAGITAAQKVRAIISCPLDALGQTMASFAGQNTGAGKIDRVRKGVYAASLSGFVWSALCIPMAIFLSNTLTGMFLDVPDPQVLAYAKEYMVITAYGFSFLTLIFVLRNTLQGMGHSGIAMGAGVLETVGRFFAIVLSVPALGFTGVCLADVSAWVAAMFLLIPAVLIFTGKNRPKRPRTQIHFGKRAGQHG